MKATTGSADPPSGAFGTGTSRPRRAVLAGCAAGLAASCSALGEPRRAEDAGRRSHAVRVVARGWHTDVGLPADRLPAPLLALALDFPGAGHFLFGFGERAYWTRPDPGSMDALAALVPGPGVVLVTALRVPPEAAFAAEDVALLPVAEGGLDRLAAHLAAELREGGEVRRLADGPYPGSRFYATSRRYSAAYTCNTWTADALQVAGTGVSASGVLFAGQLMDRARAVVLRTRSAGTIAPAERTGRAYPDDAPPVPGSDPPAKRGRASR